MKEKTQYSKLSLSIILASDIVSTSGDDNILDWIPTATNLENDECFAI